MLVKLAVLEGKEPDRDWLCKIRLFSLESFPIDEGIVPEIMEEKWSKNCISCGKSASVPATS